ncbi:MAG: sulfatase-like hydrolase/transferase [Bryobacteraceae bacterium]
MLTRKPASPPSALHTLLLPARLCLVLLLAGVAKSAQPSTPVILISVDTLRADHLGCYQAKRAVTPHIDPLTKNGTLFSQINTPFPLTLPAHVALFTSTFPFANGVEDNGIPLRPGVPTLTTVLKKAGYHTGAFVGSFVLDRRFGLSRGFDVYDGPLDLHDNPASVPIDHKRPGEQVANAAKSWLEHNSNGAFFLFLHLYDLHEPYTLPPDPSLRHGEIGYEAELGYVDRILGDFFSFLEHRGLLEKTLIVFTSDHGEGLGEHGESSHGYFVYQSTLHVPLIIRWPAGTKRLPSRIAEPSSLLDVAPTILDALGVAAPPEMRGRSLLHGGSEEVYSESVYARNHFGCAPLQTLRAGDYKYIDAPKPELYDLSSDPGERRNLYNQQGPRAVTLRKGIIALRAAYPAEKRKPAAPSPDTITALRSLGYLSGPRASGAESHMDPKDRIADFELYIRALSLSNAGKLADAENLLEGLSAKIPGVADIAMSLGMNQERLGDYGNAENQFARAIKLAPSDAPAHFELGLCYFRLKQPDDAIKQLKAALALEPWYTRADEALAEIYLHNKDLPQARQYLDNILAVDPESYTAHFNLGVFAALQQDWDEAQRQMLSALQADPGSAEAHNALGGIYLQRSELDLARTQFEDATRLRPKFAQAHYNLGVVLQKQGKNSEAAVQFSAAEEAAH